MNFALYFLGPAGSFCYHSICEGIHGATFGKFGCGLRVVSVDGGRSTVKGAVIRSLAYFIDSFAFGAVAYERMKKSPLNQRFGDVWGKTTVYNIKGTAAEAERSDNRFVLGLILGILSWLACVFLAVMGTAM